MLPAQEAARRTRSVFRATDDAPPADPAPAPDAGSGAETAPMAAEPGLLPAELPAAQLGAPAAAASTDPAPLAAPPGVPGNFPPPIASPGRFAPPQPFAAPSASFVAPAAAPAPGAGQAAAAPIVGQAAADPADAGSDEDSSMRSVLKRPSSTQATSPPAAPAVARPGRGGQASSRRTSSAPAAGRPAPAAPAADADRLRLTSNAERTVTRRAVGPALAVELISPERITAGKPAAFQIQVSNDSDVQADEVQVRATLPPGAAIHAAQASDGQAVQADDPAGARLQWTIPQLPGRTRQQLRLEVIVGDQETVDLGLEWAHKAVATKTTVAVQRPKLELSLAGAAEMTFGEEKTFTLTVANPGSGDAEHVVVAISSGDAPPQPVEIGTIPAGHQHEVSLQVVASLAGEMELKAEATGDGGLKAQALAKIIVRKPELTLSLAGPPLKFAGTEAVYSVTIANQGSAAAENVNLSLALPPGARYVGGIEGAQASGNRLEWKLGALAAGGEKTYSVRLVLATPGANRVAAQVQAQAGLTAAAETETAVEAVSDLKLVVQDPSGPVPTDDEAVYEVKVMNRGSQAAERVKVVMQFSHGIEPIGFEGCQARIVPGQVICQPLPLLGAGEQVTLRIRAKAQQAGNHQFRVEVTSAEDARLVSEGTTRFFAESGRSSAAASTASSAAGTPGKVTR